MTVPKSQYTPDEWEQMFSEDYLFRATDQRYNPYMGTLDGRELNGVLTDADVKKIEFICGTNERRAIEALRKKFNVPRPLPDYSDITKASEGPW